MGGGGLLLWVILVLLVPFLYKGGHVAEGLGCNLGLRSSNPLPPDIVVRMLKDNGFDKVKLFEPDALVLKALGRSGIQVMVGIPNELLAPLANSVQAAEQWVMQNVSSYISKNGVDIRYVAVGNEPFLKNYKGMFEASTLPALQNIQAALIKAGLAKQVKVTVPLNADVYQSDKAGLPSSGDFRSDIHTVMISIARFLQDNGGILAINIYPFLSLYFDSHFPMDYAFFDGTASPIVDGPITYTNVFEANYDTLIWALEKNNLSSLPVVVGEIGWPTDGNINANPVNARRFNQGLINRVVQGTGTPKRPNPPDIYFFGLIDEDTKSILPGNFERHWGIFNYDGTLKYSLVLNNGRNLVPAKGVKYLAKQWCVLSPQANLMDPNIVNSVNYACTYADCTSLGEGSSCNSLDVRSNVSYAFNQYYQTAVQMKGSCNFSGLSVITTTDPSQGSCRYEIMIDVGTHEIPGPPPSSSSSSPAHGSPPSSAGHGSLWNPKNMVALVALLWTICAALV